MKFISSRHRAISSLFIYIPLSSGELSNYDLFFPNKGLTSFVNQTWSVNLNMLTICFWMQTVDKDDGALFSYAVPNSMNEVTIFKDQLAIDHKYRLTNKINKPLLENKF